MVNVTEFEARLKGGHYETPANARRAAFHLKVPKHVLDRVLTGIDAYFGKPFQYATPTGKAEAGRASTRLTSSFAEAAAAREAKRQKQSEGGRKGGLARQEALRQKKNPDNSRFREAALARWQKQAPPPEVIHQGSHGVQPELFAKLVEKVDRIQASVTPDQAGAAAFAKEVLARLDAIEAPPPAPIVAPPPPAAPVVVDLKLESDRVVRELAEKLGPAKPPMPEGSEHALNMLLNSTRELFETLAEHAKHDERVRPDVLRVAHVASGLAELGVEVIRDRLRRGPVEPVVYTPPSSPALADAAQ